MSARKDLKKKSPHKIEKKIRAILIIPVVVFTLNHHLIALKNIGKKKELFVMLVVISSILLDKFKPFFFGQKLSKEYLIFGEIGYCFSHFEISNFFKFPNLAKLVELTLGKK